MKHDSISRYHAVLQWSSERKLLYIYDLGSSNGTFVNKSLISKRCYVELRSGYSVRFGASTRLYVFEGDLDPQDLIEDDTRAPSREQMKKLYEKYKRINRTVREKRIKNNVNDRRDIDWGMKDLAVDSQLIVTSEKDTDGYNAIDQFYYADPKSALNQFFDKEGQVLEFDVKSLDWSTHNCSVSLPYIDPDTGRSVIIETTLEDGRKTDCVRKCALEACEYLDRLGVLREEQTKRQNRDWEANDYYDSDEDTFFDRTGDLEKKRARRMERMGVGKNEEMAAIKTTRSLAEDMKTLIREEQGIKLDLDKSAKAEKAAEDGDVDAYVQSLVNGALDSRQRLRLKVRLNEISRLKKSTTNLARIAATTKTDFGDWKKTIEQFEEDILREATEKTVTAKKVDGERVFPVKKLSKTEPILVNKKDDDISERFIDWVPPMNQSGDGRSSLNDKLGY
ncbi:hypothetical protein ACOME3_007466 [Neoechinorhynchus agilis]